MHFNLSRMRLIGGVGIPIGINVSVSSTVIK